MQASAHPPEIGLLLRLLDEAYSQAPDTRREARRISAQRLELVRAVRSRLVASVAFRS